VISCSSDQNTKYNIDYVWEVMQKYWKGFKESERMSEVRGQQRQSWMWKLLQEELIQRFTKNPKVQEMLPEMESQVKEGSIPPGSAADQLISAFTSSSKEPK